MDGYIVIELDVEVIELLDLFPALVELTNPVFCE